MAGEGRARNLGIDALRGAVMVLMVLDHARDFYFGAGRANPTDLATTTPVFFFTRWVTHFCAPVFVFLAGTSAYLYGARRGPEALTRFLLSRGLFLVVLELTVVRLCWIPDPTYRFTLLQVIWAIGWSMVVLAAASRLPLAAVGALGGAVVLGHNLLDGIHAKDLGPWSTLWAILHERTMLMPLPGRQVFVAYPLLAWVGVIMLGYAFGAVMRKDGEVRRRATLRLGLAAVAAFVLLRAVNVYGDPRPWSVQPSGAFTVLSFLNCEKYPPSLLFLLMTLGPALCALVVLDADRVPGAPARVRAPLVVLGSVPLFFYVAHLALLRYSALPIAYARFGPEAFRPPPGRAGSPEFDLWVTYFAWICAVLVLYPACVWFRRKKERSGGGWLSYF